ncbi:30S ribosomal protein S4e [Candidatus Micrarchaeota archaeon]|nr:30S ribosomal protein S4e [Candidatus Micrarchaeota archaeon]
MPRAYPIARKKFVFVKKPSSGRHPLDASISISVVLCDVLELCASMSEAKKAIGAGLVLIDGLKANSAKQPVGLMDVISIPTLKKNFIILIEKQKMVLKPTSSSKEKYCKIIGKQLIKGGKTQLSFHDGRSILAEKAEAKFALGDTVKLAVPSQKVVSYIKLEKGSKCVIDSGKHSGKLGILEEILERPGSTPSDARLNAGGEELLTRKDYLFAVDEGFGK